jgi:branched-chain amino acid transport system permease protein
MTANRLSAWVSAILLLCLALVPFYANWSQEPFLLTFFSRVLIFSLAALSLNLILGFAGLVSFGHALYMGLGAYSVGLLAFHGIDNGWLQLLITILACAVVGAVTGFISLRTSGIAFIMITLAFAQMFFYLVISMKQYGGDDGLSIASRSQFGLFNLSSATTLYYVAFVFVVAVLTWFNRLIQSPFGMVLSGCRMNERRMKALGFQTTRYKLTAYVVACVLAGVAGLLYANLTGYASPAYMAWTLSGELIVMVVLGGMGTVMGPLVGTLALLSFEEVLKGMTDHWPIVLGPLIILVVLTARRGLYGYLLKGDAK